MNKLEEKEYNNIYAIPANYTDSGKIFGGMLEPRNAIEAAIVVILIGYPELMLIPMPGTIRIVVMTITIIPLAVIAMMGIDGDSLFQYTGHIFRYLPVSYQHLDVYKRQSGLFFNALGTDMTAMEEYFPFVEKAFTVMQYTAWAILFLITVWQLFRIFGGPITEAENPLTLMARSSLFALLIGYAKPMFSLVLDIATAPYTALMDISMTGEDFTFAGVEQALSNGLTTIVSVVSVVGLLLLVILEIALGWNYFKLLLETVERYIVVGVLCYTSPLAYAMGASKTTRNVFKSWCRCV